MKQWRREKSEKTQIGMAKNKQHEKSRERKRNRSEENGVISRKGIEIGGIENIEAKEIIISKQHICEKHREETAAWRGERKRNKHQ